MERLSDDRGRLEGRPDELPGEAEMAAAEAAIGRLVGAVRAPAGEPLEPAVLAAVRPLARRRAWWRWLPVGLSSALVVAGALLLEMLPSGAALASMPQRSAIGGLHAVLALAEGWRTVLTALAAMDVPSLARGAATAVALLGATATALLLRRWRKVAAWRRSD